MSHMAFNIGAAMKARKASHSGFTLIELLVVVAIIAVLISILVPALGRARYQARLVVCGSQLHQVGLGIALYSDASNGRIPQGPDPETPNGIAFSRQWASNLIWIGDGFGDPPPRQVTGLGWLLELRFAADKMLFCPGDDTSNLEEELPKIGTEAFAFGSYMYRQIDHLPDGEGRLDALGVNTVDGQQVPVKSLAFDTNSLGDGDAHHTNHKSADVNVMFIDGGVTRFANKDNVLGLSAEALADWTRLEFWIDQLLTNADYAFTASPAKAPRLQALTQ
jgi:prepilin-type N-terminal cleavage/methylation domain-containing protein